MRDVWGSAQNLYYWIGMNECVYKTINWWPGAKATVKCFFSLCSYTQRDNKIKLHLMPRELSVCCWFHFRNVDLKYNAKTHKKGEVLHKINVHFVLMYFMLFLLFFCFSGAGKCNIIGWMSKNELLFNLLQHSGSLWSCSIVMLGSNRFTIHVPDDLFYFTLKSEYQENFLLRNFQTRPMSCFFFLASVLSIAS